VSRAVSAGDIRSARGTTSTNRRVVEIGRARLRASPTCCTELVLRTITNRVLAVDGAEVKQWDVTEGALVASSTLSPLMAPRLDLVVSADGAWVASGDSRLDLSRDGTQLATVRSCVGEELRRRDLSAFFGSIHRHLATCFSLTVSGSGGSARAIRSS